MNPSMISGALFYKCDWSFIQLWHRFDRRDSILHQLLKRSDQQTTKQSTQKFPRKKRRILRYSKLQSIIVKLVNESQNSAIRFSKSLSIAVFPGIFVKTVLRDALYVEKAHYPAEENSVVNTESRWTIRWNRRTVYSRSTSSVWSSQLKYTQVNQSYSQIISAPI